MLEKINLSPDLVDGGVENKLTKEQEEAKQNMFFMFTEYLYDSRSGEYHINNFDELSYREEECKLPIQVKNKVFDKILSFYIDLMCCDEDGEFGYHKDEEFKSMIKVINLMKIKFDIPFDVIISEKTQKSVKYAILNHIDIGDNDKAFEIKRFFNIEIPFSDIENEIKKTIIFWLTHFDDGDNLVHKIQNLLDLFNISFDMINSKEIQEASEARIVSLFEKGDFNSGNKLGVMVKISSEYIESEKIQEIIRRVMIRRIKIGDIKFFFENKEELKSLNNFIKLPKVIEAAKEGAMCCLEAGNIYNVDKIKEYFEISFESLNHSEVIQAAKKGLVVRIMNDDINTANEIINDFEFTSEIVLESAREAFIYRLKETDINEATEIKDRFNITPKHQDIFDAIPDLKMFIDKLNTLSNTLVDQIYKNVDLLISLISVLNRQDAFIKTIQENPFLIEAVIENPRFASRLLIHFSKLDKHSQEGIKLLFNDKKEIVKNNPEIDPESLEFRVKIQEKLLNYKNNKKIVNAIEKSGLEKDVWLNYEGVQYFKLENGGNEIDFKDIILAPILRIKETIDTYAYTLKEVLSEYRDELLKHKVLIKNELNQEELSKMEQALETAKLNNDQKRMQGIEKGIANLKLKSEESKEINAWDKLLSDIASFTRLKDDCFRAQEQYNLAEEALDKVLEEKSPAGTKIEELKRKSKYHKDDLKTKLELMNRRIEDFKKNLPMFLEPILKEDRTKALIQEIDSRLAEHFSHFETDRSTLQNLFSERLDKEKEELSQRPMSIFVWARNPDVDLYQANYSPCCISIERGPESTITDYNTDLGIQIVNIWDEVKNEPVTAAWCYLAEDEENVKTLVIDNIESNTLYSRNYSGQLSQGLIAYLIKYAQDIGADKLVLGKANNDLPTTSEISSYKEDNTTYRKLGGYNRADGYYLEAESHGTRIVWERNIEKENKKKTKEQKKVEFEKIQTVPINESHFEIINKIEKKVYPDSLLKGQELINDIKENNGLAYSLIAEGTRKGKDSKEKVGYLIAIEDETDEGEPSIYLEDIAIIPEAQSQGIGRELLENIFENLQSKANQDKKPVLFDMHLRPSSLSLLDKMDSYLESKNIKKIEDIFVGDYYEEGGDAVYRVYQILPI